MHTFVHLLRIKPTKHFNATISKITRALGSRFAVVLGGIKLKILSSLGFFVCLSINAQADVNSSSHIEETKAIEFLYNMGINHYGASVAGMYYYRDNIHFKVSGTFRMFSYRSYTEEIIEASVEAGITLWDAEARGRSNLLNSFNFTTIGGLAYELVKVTSETTLIEEYPKHLFFYLGGDLEYNLSESFGLNLFFKEYYAINGEKEALGNWRYDFGVGLRYYIFR